MNAPTETEVKIRLPDKPKIARRLAETGFVVSVPRTFETNTLYDTSDHVLRKRGMLLRLRQVGDKQVVTWKGPEQGGPHKSRPELETAVGSLETLDKIFERLGYKPMFRYEKYRTEFEPKHSKGDSGVVTLDETPIGDFLELEGPGTWIDETASRLGFSPQDYILDSYARLYLAECERRGVQPSHMVFASHA